jgi:hypothetical protein
VEDSTDGGGEAVHGPEARVGQAEPAEQAGQRQRLAIARRDDEAHASGRVGAAQRPGRSPESLPGEAVGERVRPHADERLDELRQGIEAAPGEHLRRQPDQEVGIDEGHARQHERAAQAGLHSPVAPVARLAPLARAEHRVLGHLRARARGRRHGDERERPARERLAATDHFQVVEGIAAVRDQRRDRLAGVQGAAAPEGDHDVARRSLGRRDARARRLHARLLRDGEGRRPHACGRQRLEHQPGPIQALARDHQCARAEPGGQRAHLARAPGAKNDPRRCGQLERQSGRQAHRSLPSPARACTAHQP